MCITGKLTASVRHCSVSMRGLSAQRLAAPCNIQMKPSGTHSLVCHVKWHAEVEVVNLAGQAV